MLSARGIPLALTLSRPLLALLFAEVVLNSKYTAALAVFFLITLTDLLDGYAARRFNACSRLGAVLDVYADAFYICAALSALAWRRLVPVWFLVVIIAAFLEFLITSRLLVKILSSPRVWVFDPLGRCFAALAFASPGLVCLLAAARAPASLFLLLFILCSALAAFSAVVRIAAAVRAAVMARDSLPRDFFAK